MGDLIHFGPETLSDLITISIFFIEEWSENIYYDNSYLDKKQIFKNYPLNRKFVLVYGRGLC